MQGDVPEDLRTAYLGPGREQGSYEQRQGGAEWAEEGRERRGRRGEAVVGFGSLGEAEVHTYTPTTPLFPN